MELKQIQVKQIKKYLVEHYTFITASGKYPGIDLLRCIAVISVTLFHFDLFGFRFGFLGVDLFFTVSGFLIGGIIIDQLDKENNFSFKNFYRNRFLRIYPTYLFFVILNIGFKVGFGNVFQAPQVTDLSVRSLFSALTLTQTTLPYYLFNYGFTIDHRFIPGGTWSLVIEEHFYIIVPLLLFGFWKIGQWKAIVTFITVVIIFAFFLRIWTTSTFDPDDSNWHFANYIQFHSRFDQLAAGVLAAIVIRNFKPNSELMIILAIAILSWIIFYLYSNQNLWIVPQHMTWETIYFPSLLSIAFSSLVIGLCHFDIKSKFIIFVGRLSLPMYLGHIFVLETYSEGLIFSNLLIFGSQAPLDYALVFYALLFAYLVSLLIEYPFIRIYKTFKSR